MGHVYHNHHNKTREKIMKCFLQAGQLAAAMPPITTITSRLPTVIDSLKCVRITVDDHVMMLQATNLEQHLAIRMLNDEPAEENGDVLIDAARFRAVLALIPPTTKVRLHTRTGPEKEFHLKHLDLTFGRSRYSFPCHPPDNYPDIWARDDGETPPVTVSMGRDNMLNRLREVQSAMAASDIRHYLEGVCLDFGPNSMTLVATDGHRLSMATMPVDHAGEGFQVIIPANAVRSLFSSPLPETFLLMCYSNRIEIHGETMDYSSKLIDDRFPDYQRVLPDESTYYQIVVSVETMNGAVTRLNTGLEKKSEGIDSALMMMLTAGGQDMALTLGESGQEILPVEEYDGADFKSALNIRYVMDALKSLPAGTDRLTILVRDSNSGLVFRGKPDTTHFIMPMMV